MPFGAPAGRRTIVAFLESKVEHGRAAADEKPCWIQRKKKSMGDFAEEREEPNATSPGSATQKPNKGVYAHLIICSARGWTTQMFWGEAIPATQANNAIYGIRLCKVQISLPRAWHPVLADAVSTFSEIESNEAVV